MEQEKQAQIEQAVTTILEAVGEDTQRAGLIDTPKRVAKMYAEVFSGLTEPEFDDYKLFDSLNEGEMVLVKDIAFYSMCEHHLLPFFGTVDVIYQPHSGCVAGLSKFNDVITVLSRKPQLQERLTREIADAIERDLSAEGVFVRLKATQLCMLMKGTLQQGSQVVTIESRGLLREAGSLRDEALAMLGGTNV